MQKLITWAVTKARHVQEMTLNMENSGYEEMPTE
jgi:hypothetical protein